jgi:hypothetical protein
MSVSLVIQTGELPTQVPKGFDGDFTFFANMYFDTMQLLIRGIFGAHNTSDDNMYQMFFLYPTLLNSPFEFFRDLMTLFALTLIFP